ncbi:MAG TPA: hypothetical protein DEQ32_13795 [Gammaproteobacteria bacterium]|nr:hypothetical protein [Gammaproteobacteria bacterium]|tara:strand:- start:364 stop:576 length:213 start_codon:yes stop_codon:yes gene_type:complete
MWNLPPKQLAYISFYYFFIIFWVACIFYDLFHQTVTGFTFGYIFALFYFIARAREVAADLEVFNDHESED